GPILSARRRNFQGSASLRVFSVEFRAMRDEEAKNIVGSAACNRGMKRCVASAVRGVDVQAQVEAHGNGGDDFVIGSAITSRYSGVSVTITEAGGQHDCRGAILVDSLRVCAVFEKQAHYFNISGFCCTQEWSGSCGKRDVAVRVQALQKNSSQRG